MLSSYSNKNYILKDSYIIYESYLLLLLRFSRRDFKLFPFEFLNAKYVPIPIAIMAITIKV